MQEMNYIHLSRHDYPAISSLTIVPTQAHDLKNSRIPEYFPIATGEKVPSSCGYLLVVCNPIETL
jgi:hypothetical protein